jgi:magnesium and cobalt exporter, CNNM family
MTSGEIIFWWFVVLLGIGGSAMCSGLEVGLYTVNRVLVRVRSIGDEGSNSAKILQRQLEHPNHVLSSLLVWNNLFNYAGTLAITTLIATYGLSDLELILVQVVVLTPVLLIFAESTPKEIFRSNANSEMERFAMVVRFMRLSLTWIPIVPMLLWFATLASKAFGTDSFGSLTSARERMAELIKFGSNQMSDAQVTLIDRALELEHATVRSEMVPLKNAVALRAGWSVVKAKEFVRNHEFTRYPVISHRGHVVGVLSSLDLYIDPKAQTAKTIEELIVEPILIEASMRVSQAIQRLSVESARMGIVVIQKREVGIITRKDLIEPLVGELEDW